MRQSENRRLRNRQVMSRMRTAIKGFRQAAGAEGGDAAALEQQYRSVAVVIDKAVTKGVIHRKNASRKISRLAQLLQSSTATPAP